MFSDSLAIGGNLTATVLAQGGAVVSPLTTPTGLTVVPSNQNANFPQSFVYYRVSAFNSLGETLACPEVAYFPPIPTAQNGMAIRWIPVIGATGYYLYGRTTGTETRMATILGGLNSSFSDNLIGSNVPDGITFPLTANTTGKAVLNEGLLLPTGGAGDFTGTATLVGGTVTIPTTKIAAGSKVFFSRNTPGGTVGELSAPGASIVAGTSFVINSDNALDTSTVNWWFAN